MRRDDPRFDLPISEIYHARVYDPVKAREYYLRTRKLKGRKQGSSPQIGSARTRMTPVNGAAARNAQKARNEKRRKAAEARVEELKGRLERLRTLLDSLVREAQARAGVEKKDPRSPAQKQAAEKGKSPLSAKEKRDAAKRAKESYEKNKKPSPNQEAENLEASIEQVREKIRQIRAELKTAAQKSRAQYNSANSVNSTKSTSGRPLARHRQ